AIKDNPKLNTRLWTGKHPVRLLIDPDLRGIQQNKNLNLFNQSIKTIVFCKQPMENSKNLSFEKLDFGQEIAPQLLTKLYEHNLQSVIIEGGRATLNSFIKSGFWDEARVFTGQPYFKTGIKAPDFKYKP